MSGENVDIEKGVMKVAKFRDLDVVPFLRKNRQVKNYAFDMTLHENIDSIITEIDIFEHPDKFKIGKLLIDIGRSKR